MLLWRWGWEEKSPKEGEAEAEGGGAYCPGVTWKSHGVLGSEIEVNLKKGFESTPQDNTLFNLWKQQVSVWKLYHPHAHVPFWLLSPTSAASLAHWECQPHM